MDKDNLIQKSIKHCKEKGYTDVVKIATEMNIGVYMVDEDDDFNANIEIDPTSKETSIYVNTNHPISRQRFSIAHELAHFVLHKERLIKDGKINRIDMKDDKYDDDELDADNLAAEFLMPKEIVNEYISKNLIDNKITDKQHIYDIAKKFNVSVITAIIRLKALGYKVPYLSFS